MSKQDRKSDGPSPESTLGQAVLKQKGGEPPSAQGLVAAVVFLQGKWGFPHLGASLKHGLGLSEQLMLVLQFRNISMGLNIPLQPPVILK